MKPNTMRVGRSAYYETRAHGKEPTKRQRAEIEIEFESLVSSLQAATVEYDELSARLKRKRKTGELTRRSKRRLRRAGKEVRKRREDLNVYMYYHDINLLMLESPRSYACMLCRNKQLTEGDDGEEYCRFRQEELDEE